MDKELMTKLYEQFVEDASNKVVSKLLAAQNKSDNNKIDLTVKRIAVDKLITDKESIAKEHGLDRFIYKVDY